MGNFNFLKKDYPELYQLCSDAAKYIDSDKSISMLKARQAIEFIVKYLGSEADDLFVNINNLEDKNIANSRIIDLFHLIRKKANRSVHNDVNADTEGVLDALTEISVWLMVGYDKKNISITQFNNREKFFLRKNGYYGDESVEEGFKVSDTINPLEAVGRFSDEDIEPIDALEQDVFETYEEYCERIESMPPVKIGYAFLDSSQIDDFCGIAFPLFHVSKHSKIESSSVAAFYASNISKDTNIDGILKAKLKVCGDKIYYDYDSVTLQDDNDEIPLSSVSWEKYDYETEEQYARRISNLPLLPVAIAKPIRKEYDLQKQSLPFETISLSYVSKYFTEKRILCSVDRDNAKKICLTKSPFKVYAQIKDIQTINELQIFNQEQDIVLIIKDRQTAIKKLVDFQLELYLELAEQGNTNAQYKVAKCYDEKYGDEDNGKKAEQKAFEWYKKAAEHGHIGAQYELAECYKEGYGIEEDEQKAFEWYKKAAEQGQIDAQCELAECYKEGYGIEEDEQK
uniref:tetratricopeptide repeat protein n=1 Tax=uncultured Anaerovibrio sp. TaxID=361586 RepID=UPI00260A0DA0